MHLFRASPLAGVLLVGLGSASAAQEAIPASSRDSALASATVGRAFRSSAIGEGTRPIPGAVRSHAPWAPIPVCTAPSWRWVGSRVIPDGHQGAILAWYDARAEATRQQDIYAQRIGPSGEARWVQDGVPVCTAPGEQYNESLVTDGQGGVILAWTDRRDPRFDSIYGQRITSGGTVAWATDGVRLTATDAVTPVMASDGLGGALIVWEDWTGGPRKIRAQRVDASGQLLWGPSGVGVCTVPGLHSAPKVCSDGAGGAFVAWTDARRASPGIFAQHLGSSGNPLWADQGIALCSVSSDQRALGVVESAEGCATIIWGDSRNRPKDYFGVFAQRVDAAGEPKWAPTGQPLSDATVSEHISLSIARDGEELVIAWHERRGPQFDTYAQRLDPLGNRLLGPDGIAIADGPGDQIYPRLTMDRGHGMIVALTEVLYGPFECAFVVQHTDAQGARLWEPDGLRLASLGGDYEMALASDGRGGAFAAWVGCCGDGTVFTTRATDARSRLAEVNAGGEWTGTLEAPLAKAPRRTMDSKWSPDASSIQLTMPFECPVDVVIYDAGGRLVRNLLKDRLVRGEQSAHWDLRDEQRNPVGQGVYFAVIRSPCGSRSIRVPVVR